MTLSVPKIAVMGLAAANLLLIAFFTAKGRDKIAIILTVIEVLLVTSSFYIE